MPTNAELLTRLGEGDTGAESMLVEKNMGLVYSIAGKFAGRGCDREDLVQLGAIGLIKAVKKFDVSLGVQFSTYAVPMIIGEIKRFLRDDGAVKVSRSLKEAAAKGRRCQEVLLKELGRSPTISEISQLSGLSSDLILEAFEATVAPESLEDTSDLLVVPLSNLCIVVDSELIKDLLCRAAADTEDIGKTYLSSLVVR